MGELASQQCRVGGGEGVEWMKGRESEREKLGWKVGRAGEVGGGRSRSPGRADGRTDNQRGRKNALRRERKPARVERTGGRAGGRRLDKAQGRSGGSAPTRRRRRTQAGKNRLPQMKAASILVMVHPLRRVRRSKDYERDVGMNWRRHGVGGRWRVPSDRCS